MKEPRVVYVVPDTGDHIEHDGTPAFVKKTDTSPTGYRDSFTLEPVEVRPLPYTPPKPRIDPQPSAVSTFESTVQRAADYQKMHSGGDKLIYIPPEPPRPQHEAFCSIMCGGGCNCFAGRK